MEDACRNLLNGMTKKESYKQAGYIQEGRNDNSSQLAAKYFKKQEVQDMMQAMKDGILEQCQGMTLKAFDDFLRYSLEDLPADKRGAFILKAMERTGLDAPKKVEVTHEKRTVDINKLAELLVDLGGVNGELSNANSKLIEGTAESVDS